MKPRAAVVPLVGCTKGSLRFLGAVALASIVVLALLAPPASAKRPRGSFVKDECGSVISSKLEVTYDDGHSDSSQEYGPAYEERGVFVGAKYFNTSVKGDMSLYARWQVGSAPEFFPLAARDGARGSEDGRTTRQVTTDGPTWFEMRLHLGKRVIKIRRTPRWPGSRAGRLGPGDSNRASGPFDDLFADKWGLSFSLRGYLGRLRRHEASGGKTRVSFRYRLPAATIVRTTRYEPEPGGPPVPDPVLFKETSTASGVSPGECRATSRKLTLTRR